LNLSEIFQISAKTEISVFWQKTKILESKVYDISQPIFVGEGK